jgi:hypothetical protein
MLILLKPINWKANFMQDFKLNDISGGANRSIAELALKRLSIHRSLRVFIDAKQSVVEEHIEFILNSTRYTFWAEELKTRCRHSLNYISSTFKSEDELVQRELTKMTYDVIMELIVSQEDYKDSEMFKHYEEESLHFNDVGEPDIVEEFGDEIDKEDGRKSN